MLIVDEGGIRPYDWESATALFTLVSARYERGSSIPRPNGGFGEQGHLLGDSVMAAAFLGRLLRHRQVLNTRGKSSRLSQRLQAMVNQAQPATPLHSAASAAASGWWNHRSP